MLSAASDKYISRAPHVGQTNHGRLGREELEREVVGAIGQRVDLIRDPLHRGRGSGEA
jgi:hypothetical protein